METNTMIEGKYYHLQYYHQKDNEWIILYRGLKADGKISTKYISATNSYFGEDNLGTMDGITKCIPATQEEIEWLDECIAQAKFIPFVKKKAVNNYQIY
jgi:hypothetical protein